MRGPEYEIQQTLDLLDERACAYQKCMVFMRQAYPNGAVMTYDNRQARGAEHEQLIKYVIGIGEDTPRWLTYQECTDRTTADNIPGGLLSRTVTENGESFEAALYPLLFGDTSPREWEGCGLLHIHSDSQKRFWLKFGNGNLSFMHFSPNKNIAGPDIDCREGNCNIDSADPSKVIVTRKDRVITTVVKGNFDTLSIEKIADAEEGYGTYAIASAKGTDIYVVFAFAENPKRAYGIADCDPCKEEEKVRQYYRKAMDSWKLDTPDKDLNEAFTHAMLNVEYAWLNPYGWIESIQHWPTMWHMEHTAAEEWNENYDRVVKCLRSQMQNVFENGAIPDMCPTGKGRRDWGGNNQFFLREVEHYVKMTGDLDFAREAEPYMEKALQQSFAEYDPTGSGILAWGTQIGNQEDFESTPGMGAGPGIEGVRMLEIMGYIKEITGKKDEADKYYAASESCKKKWYDTLWKKDIGRTVWFRDLQGEQRLETTYHGITYPIIYGYLDDKDVYTSLDHLKHRLTGPEGEMYQTNHFGDHAYWNVPTWGMQCGSDMQPFGTAAYAKAGMKEDAVKPLIYIARRVCGEYQRGSWPETANEKRFAYFSPSAAVFSQSIIEDIFGLKRDMISNRTFISPVIPQSWPRAALHLKSVDAEYINIENGFKLKVSINDNTQKIVRIIAPVSSKIEVKIGSSVYQPEIVGHIGRTEAQVILGNDKEYELECKWTPIEFKCEYTRSIACGGRWQARVDSDTKIVGIEDPQNLLSSVKWGNENIEADIKPDLMDEYSSYGWFGIINFARRTVFLRLESRGCQFLHPCNITIMPPVYCKGLFCKDTNTVILNVWNQTDKALEGPWHVLAGKKHLAGSGKINPRSKGEVILPAGNANDWAPGKNRGVLSGPVELDIEIEAGYWGQNVRTLPIPDELCFDPKEWRSIGMFPHHGCMVSQGHDNFMKGLFSGFDRIPIMQGLSLKLNKKGFVPFSKEKYPFVTIPMPSEPVRKLYLLVSAFVDNHDVFSRIIRIEAEAEKKDSYIRPIFTRDCYYPGDLDMGFGRRTVVGFETFNQSVNRDFVPEFPVNSSDYPDVMPPEYPQRKLWSFNKAIECADTVFNLIELDLGEYKTLKEIRVIPCGSDSAGGIFAIGAEMKM